MAENPSHGQRFVVWRKAGCYWLIVLGLCLLGFSSAQAGEGSAAMELLFNTVDGKKLRLADLRGKVVLVNFWATWCPPCLEELPELSRFHENSADKGVMVVGVTYMDPSTPEQLKSFLDRQEVRYPVLYGEANKLNQLAKELGGVFGLPVSKLLDRQGKVVASRMGGVTEASLQELVAPHLGKATAKP
ncbi:MAG: TlpA family protein disulfide reductase [Magnetococcales bacterium]|nr:TlpA family protein disulfide reductase [Magnetococcales bacterium]